MDSQDEFQFKPINEGLGFYKKKPTINLDLDKSENTTYQNLSPQPKVVQHRNQYTQRSSSYDVFQQEDKKIPYITDPGIQFDSEIDKNVFDETQRMMPHQDDILSSLQLESSKTSSQMPNPKAKSPILQEHSSPQHHSPTPLYSTSTASAQTAHPNSTYPRTSYQTDFVTKKAEPHQVTESVESHQKPQNLAPHFGAWLLDVFVITGLVLICIVPLLLITNLNVPYILTNIQIDFALQISLAILFLAVLNFYLITTRNFFGATFGEWSFDIALGDTQKRQSPIYPILIAWRCLLMNITGIVILPFLGLVTRTDILGKLTSVRLTRSF